MCPITVGIMDFVTAGGYSCKNSGSVVRLRSIAVFQETELAVVRLRSTVGESKNSVLIHPTTVSFTS